MPRRIIVREKESATTPTQVKPMGEVSFCMGGSCGAENCDILEELGTEKGFDSNQILQGGAAVVEGVRLCVHDCTKSCEAAPIQEISVGKYTGTLSEDVDFDFDKVRALIVRKVEKQMRRKARNKATIRINLLPSYNRLFPA